MNPCAFFLCSTATLTLSQKQLATLTRRIRGTITHPDEKTSALRAFHSGTRLVFTTEITFYTFNEWYFISYFANERTIPVGAIPVECFRKALGRLAFSFGREIVPPDSPLLDPFTPPESKFNSQNRYQK